MLLTAVLLLLIGLTCLVSLALPHIGVIAYYTLAVGHPQGVWPWIFQDLRVSLAVSAFAILGAGLAVLGGRADLRTLTRYQPMAMAALCVLVNLSHHFASIEAGPLGKGVSPERFIGIFNKIVLFYYVAILVVDDWRKWRVLMYTLAAIALFYTWWANSVYLSGQMWRFGSNGRLSGPAGMYEDENTFALLFVVGFPIVYYLSRLAHSKWVRFGLLASIPFLWHALLLTGSRGALLSLGVVSLYIALTSRVKTGGLIGLALLVAFVVDQGGSLVNRVNDTVERSQTVSEEDAVDPRLVSWGVGAQIIQDYPLLGVGTARFQFAFPRYSDTQAHVAHNTFLQFAADSGLPAGLIYLSFFGVTLRGLRRESLQCSLGEWQRLTMHMMAAAALGFFVCSFFLDLAIYEILYMLLVLMFARARLIAQGDPIPFESAEKPTGEPKPSRVRT